VANVLTGVTVHVEPISSVAAAEVCDEVYSTDFSSKNRKWRCSEKDSSNSSVPEFESTKVAQVDSPSSTQLPDSGSTPLNLTLQPKTTQLAQRRCEATLPAQQVLCTVIGNTIEVPRNPEELERLLQNSTQTSVVLSVSEGVSLALANSREVAIGKLGRVRDRLALDVAEDQFRPNLSIGTAIRLFEKNTGNTDDERLRDDLLDEEGQTALFLDLSFPTGGVLSIRIADEPEDNRVSGEFIQPLWRGAGLKNNLTDIKAARIDYQMGDFAFRNRIIELITSVIAAHNDLISAQNDVQAAERSLGRAKEQFENNKKLLDAGRIARSEVTVSEADIANREVELASANITLDDSRRRYLNQLDIGANVNIIAGSQKEYQRVKISTADALAAAHSLRPDYLQSLLIRKKAMAALGASKNQQRPTVDLVLRSEPDVLDGEQTISGELRLNASFGDVTRNQSAQQANLAISESDVQLSEVRNQIENEISNLLANVDTAALRIELAARAETLAQQQLDAEKKKFARGLASTLDVIELEDSLTEAQIARLQTRIEYNENLTLLDRAMGTTLFTWGVQVTDN